MVLRPVLKLSWWVTRLSARVVLWLGWLLLLVVLAAQVHLLSSRQVSLPEPLRRAIEERLTAQGLRVQLGRSRMDFSGHVILEDVSLGPVSLDTPLITVSSIYAHIDLWSLIIGQVDIDEVQVSGMDLHLPAMQSLSGVDEVMVSGIDLLVHPQGKEIGLAHLAGYVRQVPVQIYGSLPQFQGQSGVENSADLVQKIATNWLKIARQIQAADGFFSAFESPRLHLRLAPTASGQVDAEIDFSAASIDLAKLPGGATGELRGVKLDTQVVLDGREPPSLDILGTVDSLQLPREVNAEELAFRLRADAGGEYGLSPRSLELQLGALRWRAIEVGPVVVTASQSAQAEVVADFSLMLAGSPWRLRGELDPRLGAAQVSLEGQVDAATLAFASGQIGKDLGSLLVPAQSAPLRVNATFGPDWKLTRATGRLHSGCVLVGGVPLDETGTEFTYDGNYVVCDNLVLRLGDSLAHGSYAMNTRTLDFRFLLTGGLRPAGIDNWFHGWWIDFWKPFTFNNTVPVADVDVRGRWGDLTATQVFVQADCPDTTIKGLNFDRVRTQLFLRPHWFDIRHFEVNRSGQGAQGRLVRSLDLAKNTWRSMEFDVDSTLPLESIAQLFKAESASLLAPYVFTVPPRLQLSGRVDSIVAPAGKHEKIDIQLFSSGQMTYYGVPLSDLTFQAHLRDELIEVPTISAVFAKGQVQGTATVNGTGDARRLAFNITLAKANLGEVTQAVADLQSTTYTAVASAPVKKTTQARQVMHEKGLLDMNIAAEGLYNDFYSFNGAGNAVISGAELGHLNLFGPLSEALKGTFINLGSFSLTSLDAPFNLQGDRVRFDELHVTGPSALIDAKGYYRLRDGALDFTAKLYPFNESSSLVGSAVGFVLTPLSRVLEVKLEGTLVHPSWIFAYGPIRLLNTLIGGEKNAKPSTGSDSSPLVNP
jgi:AsmA-like C-terminal region